MRKSTLLRCVYFHFSSVSIVPVMYFALLGWKINPSHSWVRVIERTYSTKIGAGHAFGLNAHTEARRRRRISQSATKCYGQKQKQKA